MGRFLDRRPSGILHRHSPSVAGLLAVVLVLWSLAGLPTVAQAAPGDTSLPDFPIPSGHFYTQASGRGVAYGFAIADDPAGRFFSEFNRLGGVDKLGYPSSQRFTYGGLVTQATQKQLLQWRPDSGQVEFVNLFDAFSARGLDPLLSRSDLIPPSADNAADARLSWPQVVARHLALLDQDPAIKAYYFADANPIADFGLPQGTGDYGSVFVIRCERAAFQHWRVATSFANPGEVTQVNAGDLAKQLGLVPAADADPTTAASQLVAPPGATLAADPVTQATAREVAVAAAPSLVRIDVTLPGGAGIASGIVLDQNGDILTNEHVVDLAQSVKITFVNGTSASARIVGVDLIDDLAVVQVLPSALGPGVVPANLRPGPPLTAGEDVVALGYSPFFPTPPAVRLGVYQATVHQGVGLLSSDVYILPGDSGGMLLDLAGHVVGINDEIRFTHQSQQPLVGFSIAAADAVRIAARLIDGGGAPATYLGAELITLTPDVQAALGLLMDHGVVALAVDPGGPADQAGLAAGDVIEAVDGSPVTRARDVQTALAQHAPGDALALTVVRGDGQALTVNVVLGAWPQTSRS
jgi:serine protease Do